MLTTDLVKTAAKQFIDKNKFMFFIWNLYFEDLEKSLAERDLY